MSDASGSSGVKKDLSEIKRAVKHLGHDMAAEVEKVDQKLGQLSSKTDRDSRRVASGVSHELSDIKEKVSTEARKLPGQAAEAGRVVAGAAKEGAGVAATAVSSGASKAKEGTKELFARAAGVKKRPMKAWSPPSSDGAEDEKPSS